LVGTRLVSGETRDGPGSEGRTPLRQAQGRLSGQPAGLRRYGRQATNDLRHVAGQPSGADDAFWAIRLGAGIGDAVALTVEADDEHGASVAVASGLTGREDRRFAASGSHVANALSEATMAEFVGAAKEGDGVVGVVGRESQFHGAVVLVAEGQDVRPHAKRV
jgi:hypothetical protein